MTAPLELQSERYSALGNLASEGVQNQLGRPRLDPLTVLVRESVQNSWDAHDADDPHIRFDLHVRRLGPPELTALREVVFPATPRNLDIQKRLDEARQDPEASPFHFLILSDRGTCGLGGPTRADVIQEDLDEPHDFVDFLRNIGQPPDKSLGGGTFGYGKAALYAISRHSTILVYTKCRHGGRSERRFFVAGLGHGFTIGDGHDRGRYTGRHWWGRIREGVVEPLLDDDARAVAGLLGFPDFKAGEHGTTIAILDADFGLNRSPTQAVSIMQEALLWNYWPKMLADDGGAPPIRFRIVLDDQEQPLPALEDYPPLGGFRDAMEHLKAVRHGRASRHFGLCDEIWCQNPKQLLGWLSMCRMERRGRKPLQRTDAATGGITAPLSHHVALMRDAELVVKYLEGPALQTDRFEYAGVFIATRDADRAFARAEPPTHDDWVPQNLDDRRHRTFVNMALKRIREKMQEYALPTGDRRAAGERVPLGELSSSLGNLLTGLTGVGANAPKLDEKARVIAPGPTIEQPDETETGDLFGRSVGDGASADEEVSTGDTDPRDKDTATGTADVDSSEPPRDPVAAPRPRPLKPRISVAEPRLAIHDGVGVFELTVDLKHGRNSGGTRLFVDVAAELDGRAVEKEPPAGAAVPTVMHWRSADGRIVAPEATSLDVPLDATAPWTVVLRLVDDATVRASVRGEPLEAP